MDKTSAEYREERRIYAIEYRKQNAQKIKERHDWRLANDEDYAKRYKEKQERRNERYAIANAEAASRRESRRIDLAIARKERERERNRIARQARNALQRDKYNSQMREYRNANSDRVNFTRRERLKNDPEYAEKVRERDRIRSKAQSERRLNTNLKGMYGITLVEYDLKYDTQQGKCAICEEETPRRGKDRLVVDHCHTAGDVRGLLCNKCNMGIGLLRDNPNILQKAIEYLQK